MRSAIHESGFCGVNDKVCMNEGKFFGNVFCVRSEIVREFFKG